MCTVSRKQLYFERRHKHSRPYEIFTRCRRGHKDLLYAKCGRSDARFHRQVALKKNLKTQFFSATATDIAAVLSPLCAPLGSLPDAVAGWVVRPPIWG